MQQLSIWLPGWAAASAVLKELVRRDAWGVGRGYMFLQVWAASMLGSAGNAAARIVCKHL